LPSTQQEGEDEIDVGTATDKRMEENIQQRFSTVCNLICSELRGEEDNALDYEL